MLIPVLDGSDLEYVVNLEVAGDYWRLKRYDEAALEYRAAGKACALNNARQALINLYDEAKRWTEEVNAVDWYLELLPDQAWAIRRKAYAYHQLLDHRKAFPLYK